MFSLSRAACPAMCSQRNQRASRSHASSAWPGGALRGLHQPAALAACRLPMNRQSATRAPWKTRCCVTYCG